MTRRAEHEWAAVLFGGAALLALWLWRKGGPAQAIVGTDLVMPKVVPDYLSYNLPDWQKSALTLPVVSAGVPATAAAHDSSSPSSGTCGCSGGTGDLATSLGTMIDGALQQFSNLSQAYAANIMSAFPAHTPVTILGA